MYKHYLARIFFEYMLWQKDEFSRLSKERKMTNPQEQLKFERYLTEVMNYTEEESKLIIQEFKREYGTRKDKDIQ